MNHNLVSMTINQFDFMEQYSSQKASLTPIREWLTVVQNVEIIE